MHFLIHSFKENFKSKSHNVSILFISIFLMALYIQVFSDDNDQWKPNAIFAMSGQSNMAGAASAKEVPKEYLKFPKNVRMWENNQWVEFKLGEKFGPEISFAFEISKKWPKKNIGLIKLGISGAGIVDWVGKNSEEKAKKGEYPYGLLFESLTSMVKKAMKSAPDATLAGVLWMQGETDADKKPLAEQYKENLQKLIKAFRKEVSEENVPFLIGKIQAKKFPFLKEIWAAQEETAKKIPHTALINTDALEMNPDDLHFSAKGQIDLGKLFAEEYFKKFVAGQKPSRK